MGKVLFSLDKILLSEFMDWSSFKRMDPHLLVGVVNTYLRNRGVALEEFCRTHQICREQLEARLKAEGYEYLPDQAQFR